MLPYECVWLHRAIGVHLRHVHIVNEVDEFLCSRWTIVTTYMRLRKVNLHLEIKPIPPTYV